MHSMAVMTVMVLALAVMVQVPAALAAHSELRITQAEGSSLPGCEETEDGCFMPSIGTVDVGGTVIIFNTDNVAHTATSGSLEDGPDGHFDTGLAMPGTSFEWVPTEVGEYPYHCIVHPWMIGLIIVQPAGGDTGTTTSARDTPKKSDPGDDRAGDDTVAPPAASADPSELRITQAEGSSLPGCEETEDGCFMPSIGTVDVGGTVTIANTDNVAHTVTSGSLEDGPDGHFDSGLELPGASFEWVPTKAGEYPYYCVVHPWMEGLIIVRQDGDDTVAPPVMPDDQPLEKRKMLGDRTDVWFWVERINDRAEITVLFMDRTHVNYDIAVDQNGRTILDTKYAYGDNGMGVHVTRMLPADDPIDISITFRGYGASNPQSGPIGEMLKIGPVDLKPPKVDDMKDSDTTALKAELEEMRQVVVSLRKLLEEKNAEIEDLLLAIEGLILRVEALESGGG